MRLVVAFKDPDMLWLCAAWSASTSSSWQRWTPSLQSHLTLPITSFILPALRAPKINSQLSLRNCINPHFSGGFYAQEICICTSSTGSFVPLHNDFSVFFKAFLSGQLLFCFVFCEVSSCVRDGIIQTWRHGRAEFDGCRGSSSFYNCSIVLPCFFFVFCFFIVPTSQLLGSCHRSVTVYTVLCPEWVQSWSRLVPVAGCCPHICADLWHFPK